jgi:hypothetical protein
LHDGDKKSHGFTVLRSHGGVVWNISRYVFDRRLIIMDANVSQDLWQYDVTVVKKGWFTVYAQSEEEARKRIETLGGLDNILIHWEEAEVESID